MLRRTFLQIAAASILTLKPWSTALARTNCTDVERRLQLINLNTGERFQSVYWTPEGYVTDALRQLNHLLRDHHNNEIVPIDTRLLDRLYNLSLSLGTRRPVCVLSGYRSPATNAALAHRIRGVARYSYHMSGQAMDIRAEDRSLPLVRKAALQQEDGGVGYYPNKGFVHIDVGPCRQWVQHNSRSPKALCRPHSRKRHKG